MWTRTGCFVEANALTVCFTPRVKREKLLAFGIDKKTPTIVSGKIKFVIIKVEPSLFKPAEKALTAEAKAFSLYKIEFAN